MRNSKRIKIVAGGTAVLMGTGIAFAYWTTSGSGDGTATTSAGEVNQLSFVQTETPADLYPGGPAQPIAGTVTNDGEQDSYVTKVVVTIDSITQAAGAVGGCTADDYLINDGEMLVGEDLASGVSADFSGASIEFVNDELANQDGCKDATVNLTFTAS